MADSDHPVLSQDSTMEAVEEAAVSGSPSEDVQPPMVSPEAEVIQQSDEMQIHSPRSSGKQKKVAFQDHQSPKDKDDGEKGVVFQEPEIDMEDGNRRVVFQEPPMDDDNSAQRVTFQESRTDKDHGDSYVNPPESGLEAEETKVAGESDCLTANDTQPDEQQVSVGRPADLSDKHNDTETDIAADRLQHENSREAEHSNELDKTNSQVALVVEETRTMVSDNVPSEDPGTVPTVHVDHASVCTSESAPDSQSVAGQPSKPTNKGHQFCPDLVTSNPFGDQMSVGGMSAQTPAQDESDEDDSEEGVFSTAVDEETLEAAKRRQTVQNIFKPDEDRLGEMRRQPSMDQILSARAQEHYTAGMALKDSESYDKAIQAFNKAINLQPKDISLYTQRGECFLLLSDFQSAILNYKRACVLDPNNTAHYHRLAFIYYLYGQCLFDQKLYPEALEAFSRASEMRPDLIGYHTRSIACLAALQRHGECLALVNKRLETERENADIYILRARLHQLFRNTTLCYYDVKDALALAPDHNEAMRLMSMLEAKSRDFKYQATQLNLLGRHRDALQKISLAIETNPSVAEFHNIRGALHRRVGDFNSAIDDYLLALDKTDHSEESPVYAEAQRQLLLTYNDFAVECFTKGYFEEAIILLNKAIKGEKREKGLYINRGDCFFKEGNLQFALADYHQALEIHPADGAIRARLAIVHNEYGVMEFTDKHYQEAEHRFTQAIQYNPRVSQYYISRCRTRQMNENNSGARQDILIGLLLDPGSPDIMSIMARLFPGKTVKDVLQSRAATSAKEALDNLVTMASPVQLQPLSSESGESVLKKPGTTTITTRTQSMPHQSVPASLRPTDGGMPDLRTCMEEHDFNHSIAMEKKRVNTKVKDILDKREDLKPTRGRVQGMPPAMPYARAGGNPLNTKLAVNMQKTTGWRNFGLGIGIKDAFD